MSSAIHKCPSCGGNLVFDASVNKVTCGACHSQFSVSEIESFHEKKTLKDAQYKAQTHGYHCQNCGAEVVTETETSSAFCYYCHSPVLFTDKMMGNYEPDYILPFKITKEQAKTIFSKWIKKYKSVPKGFASHDHLEKITGIYIPYWMSDASASIYKSGIGDLVTMKRKGDKVYTTTKRFRFQHSCIVNIAHVKTIASDKVDQALINSVESNTKGKLEDFSTAYLSGYFSQRYTILREDVRKTHEDVIQRCVRGVADELHYYENVQYDRDEEVIDSIKWSYVLLPMWILTYNFKDKVYVYALNGESGESFGEIPIDYSRKFLRFVITFVIILAALLFLFNH